jgi:hypothetical protein
VGIGGLLGVVGSVAVLTQSPGEKLYDDYVDGLRLHADNPQLVVAEMDRRLAELASHDHTQRVFLRWTGGIVFASGAATMILSAARPHAASDSSSWFGVYYGGLTATLGGMLFATSWIPTPRERMWALWSEDPGLKERVIQPTVSAVPGGGVLGLTGRF